MEKFKLYYETNNSKNLPQVSFDIKIDEIDLKDLLEDIKDGKDTFCIERLTIDKHENCYWYVYEDTPYWVYVLIECEDGEITIDDEVLKRYGL